MTQKYFSLENTLPLAISLDLQRLINPSQSLGVWTIATFHLSSVQLQRRMCFVCGNNFRGSFFARKKGQHFGRPLFPSCVRGWKRSKENFYKSSTVQLLKCKRVIKMYPHHSSVQKWKKCKYRSTWPFVWEMMLYMEILCTFLLMTTSWLFSRQNINT